MATLKEKQPYDFYTSLHFIDDFFVLYYILYYTTHSQLFCINVRLYSVFTFIVIIKLLFPCFIIIFCTRIGYTAPSSTLNCFLRNAVTYYE